MKIYIATKTKDHAWGGGNQFLKALRQQFVQKGVAAPSMTTADAVIYNGYQELGLLVRSWVRGRRQIRVYRLGPVMSLHRAGWKWKLVDRVMVLCANLFADIVVFQSAWSYQRARQCGFRPSKRYAIIHNAVDPSIFYPKEVGPQQKEKIRIVYTSWSTNKNKGFEYLQFLDTHLDFEKYEMTFIGNTTTTFQHIKTHAPMTSPQLADELRAHDIFVSPTKDDACSNAIIEALACGLPVVALDSGANKELVKDGGVLFESTETLLGAIDTVAQNLEQYKARIVVKSMAEIRDVYLAAIYASMR